MTGRVTRRTALGSLAGSAGALVLSSADGGVAGEPGRRRGIVGVPREAADLVGPAEGAGFRYGTGYLFQAGPTQAGLLCNLRTEGFPVGDFEAGMDAVIFDDAAKIGQAKPVKVQAIVQNRFKKFPKVNPKRPSNSVLPAPQTPIICG